MLTRVGLINSVEATYKENVEIMRKKNADYATGEDALSNFKVIQAIGVVDYKRGILVRMADKFARIVNCLEKETAVSDESVADTLSDLCNYAAILKAAIEDERKQVKEYEEQTGRAWAEDHNLAI